MGLLSFLFGSKKAERKTVTQMPPGEILFSELDITERFSDDLQLKPDDWIPTVPLNKSLPDRKDLPPATASDEEVYKAAAKMSEMRESIPIPRDGVYCPICHIANTQLTKLRTPCPKCGRPLLKFGWD